MLICRNDHAPPGSGAVAAIGNFDGVHLGHQALIAMAREDAGAAGRSSAVLTFEPHPRDHFRPGDPAFRVTPEPVKLKIFSRLGLDIVFLRRFDAALAGTTAAGFVTGVLAGELSLSEVIVGGNFHFGRGREGTPASLQHLATAAGLRARIAEAVMLDGEPVSSSRVRAALEAGDIATANRQLGYRWFIAGEVRHGDKRGRTLGYPTANVRLGPGCRLRHGIYAVRIAVAPGDVRGGVASFGRRPTFDDGAPLLETYVFDFAGDLYGRSVEVEFLSWIRGEERFDSAEALIVQMDRDAETARGVLERRDGGESFIG